VNSNIEKEETRLMQRIIPTAVLCLGVAALAFAGGSYTRIGIQGAADLPTMPRAKDMVRIDTGSYIVPDGYRFVMTGYGSKGGGASLTAECSFLFVDGQYVLGLENNLPGFLLTLPPGLAFPPGALVELMHFPGPSGLPNPAGVAWGYLELDH